MEKDGLVKRVKIRKLLIDELLFVAGVTLGRSHSPWRWNFLWAPSMKARMMASASGDFFLIAGTSSKSFTSVAAARISSKLPSHMLY